MANWYPNKTGDYTVDEALQQAFKHIYALRDSMAASAPEAAAAAPAASAPEAAAAAPAASLGFTGALVITGGFTWNSKSYTTMTFIQGKLMQVS